jgi:hypothetical protein
LEKQIKYDPVADATFGGIPSVKRMGFNMKPHPRPKAPARNPPKNPSIIR